MVITLTLVLFLCLNFVLLYLFLKTVDHRKWLVLLISAVLTPISYFYLFYPFLNIISGYHHQKNFNSQTWKNRPELRYEMIDQMMVSKELNGISAKRAEELFGPAEWFSWDERLKQHDSSKWNYGLGIEPGAFNTLKTNAQFVFEKGHLSDISSYKEEITYDVKDQ